MRCDLNAGTASQNGTIEAVVQTQHADGQEYYGAELTVSDPYSGAQSLFYTYEGTYAANDLGTEDNTGHLTLGAGIGYGDQSITYEVGADVTVTHALVDAATLPAIEGEPVDILMLDEKGERTAHDRGRIDGHARAWHPHGQRARRDAALRRSHRLLSRNHKITLAGRVQKRGGVLSRPHRAGSSGKNCSPAPRARREKCLPGSGRAPGEPCAVNPRAGEEARAGKRGERRGTSAMKPVSGSQRREARFRKPCAVKPCTVKPRAGEEARAVKRGERRGTSAVKPVSGSPAP